MRVATLFKSEVRNIDINCTAGAERMWLKDLQLLDKHFTNLKIYSAASINLPPNLKRKHIRIPYPHFFLDYLEKSKQKAKHKFIRGVTDHLHWFFMNMAEIYYALAFIILERKADLYYVYQCPVVALISPKKTVMAWHNFSSNIIFAQAFFRRYRQTVMTFCSQFLLDQFKRHYMNLVSENWHVIYNSVDTNLFKGKRNIVHDKISFGFFSNWNTSKGFYVFLELIKKINKRFKNKVEFVIGGSTDLWSLPGWIKDEEARKASKKLEETIGEYSNIRVVGKINYNKLLKIYGELDYVIFPSLMSEPFGNIVIESMSCGTPVVGYRTGALREIIEDGVNGYLVKKNLLDLDRAVASLIKNFSLKEYLKMGQMSKRTVRMKFNDQKREKSLIKLISG